MNQSTLATPLADEVTQRLQALNPIFLNLENESMRHAGYFEGKESHFKLVIVSDSFAGKRLVQRHQLVFGLVNDLLAQGGGTIHAFSLHTYTADEWQGQNPQSPNCAGQNKG
ncbi:MULTISPECIES: BolA family protein [unclassified Moraxella]|uniref:BolA family protein n=1 Tax=unclassified Moraxella TaxID=2685852 RepID=UPI003AF67B4A